MGKLVEPRGQIKAEPCSTDVFLSDYRKVDRIVTSQTLKTLSRRDKRNSGEGVKEFTYTMFQQRHGLERETHF